MKFANFEIVIKRNIFWLTRFTEIEKLAQSFLMTGSYY